MTAKVFASMQHTLALTPSILTLTQTLARMLSVIPLAARGPTQIFIFDIHALQERFYFSDQIIPRFPKSRIIIIYFSCSL